MHHVGRVPETCCKWYYCCQARSTDGRAGCSLVLSACFADSLLLLWRRLRLCCCCCCRLLLLLLASAAAAATTAAATALLQRTASYCCWSCSFFCNSSISLAKCMMDYGLRMCCCFCFFCSAPTKENYMYPYAMLVVHRRSTTAGIDAAPHYQLIVYIYKRVQFIRVVYGYPSVYGAVF